MSEKVQYYRMSIPVYGDAGYISTLEDLMAEIKGNEEEDTYMIQPVQMTTEEVSALPEFDGF